MRTATKPRYIKPETICIGDVIRYATEVDDIEVAKTGYVGSREYVGQWVHILSPKGTVILIWHPAHPLPGRITLLQAAATQTQVTLEGLD